MMSEKGALVENLLQPVKINIFFSSGASVLMKLMQFKAVNNREHCLMLLVGTQCGGTSAVTLACINSMCLVQHFHGT